MPLIVPSGQSRRSAGSGMGVPEGVGQQNAVALALLDSPRAAARARAPGCRRRRHRAGSADRRLDPRSRSIASSGSSGRRPRRRSSARLRATAIIQVMGDPLSGAGSRRRGCQMRRIDLLQHLARLLAIAQDTQHDAEQLRAAGRVQVSERALIARRGAIEKVGERRRLGLGVIRPSLRASLSAVWGSTC